MMLKIKQRTMRGQATVEFVVAALVLVPLFIAIPLLAKYLDMMQAAEQASRYVAFEGAARNTSNSWKSDAELGVEVRRRFFSTSSAPIKTGDAPGDFTADRNPMWTDQAGNPLLKNFEQDVTVNTQASSKAAISEAAAFVRGALNLSNDNWYRGQVTIRIADVPNFAPFDALSLTTTRRTVLLADAWTGRDPGSIRSRIEGSPLVYPLGAAKPLVDAFGMTPTLVFDPKLEVGNFDWDIVPCDRLIGGC